MKVNNHLLKCFFLGVIITSFSACGCFKKFSSKLIVADDSKIASKSFLKPIPNELILKNPNSIDPDTLCQLKKDLGIIPPNADCNTVSGQIEKCACGENIERWTIPNSIDDLTIERAIGTVRAEQGSELEGGGITRNSSLQMAPIDSIVTGRFRDKDIIQGNFPPNVESTNFTSPLLKGVTIPAKIKEYNSGEIIVAVIDTGIDMSAFKNNEIKFLNSSNFNSNNCTSNPNNRPTTGWNFVDNNSNIGDKNGHGTFVAKNILNNLSNSQEKISFLPLKVFSDSGTGTIWDIICAFAYVKRIQSETNYDIAVVNASFGASIEKELYKEEDFLLFKQYIDMLNGESVVISSAGNVGDDNDIKYHFPSSFSSNVLFAGISSTNLLSVAGLSNNSELKLFQSSNRGKNSVNISAPWEYIINLSNELEIIENLFDGNNKGLNFAKLEGTSYSASFVSSKILDEILQNSSPLRGSLLLNKYLGKQSIETTLKENVKDGKYIKK
ncbi:hypothetical protein D9O36_02400 [Zobellia amurskyensis]|uniref:Peptidase S8/S53 domain-containing protein n=1 Tax=Zobellia amurskyensis TaxID=248905 RepID=A0A7X3D090_9FLAO|nr:S8 family serine peptidase [Zobellia amurskyensis]MUH34681.1 hypothetical protein [Zobellia amurskyensis]